MILKKIILAILMLCYFSAASAVDFGRIKADEITFYIQDIVTGEILAEHHADQAMNPASTMKLVTSFAALHKRNSAYRWRTQWFSDGKIEKGILKGNIYWKGSGNPVFDQNDLQYMQKQLLEKGIYDIDGDVVLDTSIWNNFGASEGFDEDKNRTFSTPPHPNMLSYKVLWIEAKKMSEGNMVLQLSPPLPEDILDLKISTSSAKNCTNLNSFVDYSLQKQQIKIRAKLPSACDGKKMFINVLNMQSFLQQSFLGYWHQLNGLGPKNIRIGRLPFNRDLAILAEHESKPLGKVIQDMNKFSNNLIARTLFLNLGEDAHSEDTVQAATQYIYNLFKKVGVGTHDLVLENGSGLSRKERISARTMGQMLEYIYFSQFSQSFIKSLPIAGKDGTLKNRFLSLPSLRLKTGTLKNVRALAGYWLPESNHQHPLVVVVILNSEQASLYAKDFDALTRSLILPFISDFPKNMYQITLNDTL